MKKVNILFGSIFASLLLCFSISVNASDSFGAREHVIDNSGNSMFNTTVSLRTFKGKKSRMMTVLKGMKKSFDNDGSKFWSGDYAHIELRSPAGETKVIDTYLPNKNRIIAARTTWRGKVIVVLISTDGAGSFGRESRYVYKIELRNA